MLDKDIERFKKKMLPQESGCVYFDGCTDAAGYPVFWRTDGSQRAARTAFEIFKETPSRFLVIRHTCDDPACINPEHLLQGTHAENTGDMLRRNRQKKATRLIPEIIELIVNLTKQGRNGASIASTLSISPSSVSTVRSKFRRSICRNGNTLGIPGTHKKRGLYCVWDLGQRNVLGKFDDLKEAACCRLDYDIENELLICWDFQRIIKG